MLAHVANQLSSFEWPSTEQVMQQYKDLMHAWSLLLNDKEIAKQVFGSTTLVASQGHSSQHHFDWLQWWKLSHTDPRFLPPGTEAAFVLFHFMGMVGVSEAGAESIASLLKRYSPSVASRINTERVIEKTIVASVGIKGLFTDDLFLLRCWVEYFGGMQHKRFSFRYEGAQSRRRAKRFPLGGGSKTIHNHLKRVQLEKRCNKSWKNYFSVLRSLPRLGRLEGGRVIAGSGAWLQRLRRQW